MRYDRGVRGLDRNLVACLILQHLDIKGHKEARKVLEKELKVKCAYHCTRFFYHMPHTNVILVGPKESLTESRLVRYLINSIKQTEKVFDLSIGLLLTLTATLTIFRRRQEQF